MLQFLMKSHKDQSGFAALEFALTIPLFFVLVFGALDVIRLLHAEERLDRLARDLAFYYKYGVSIENKSGLNQSDLVVKARALASSSSSFVISAEALIATSEVYTNLLDYASDRPVKDGPLSGLSGQIVVYRLDYSLPLSSPMLMLLHDGSVASVTAFSVSKNGH